MDDFSNSSRCTIFELPCGCPTLLGTEAKLALQTERHVFDYVEPGIQTVFLKQHQPVMMWPIYDVSIERDFAIVGD